MGRGITKQRKTLAVAASVIFACLALAAIAEAGISQSGHLQVSFEGGIRPSTLPAPIPPR